MKRDKFYDLREKFLLGALANPSGAQVAENISGMARLHMINTLL